RSFEQPYNNGSLEGTNNVIKTIKRVAFGFRSFPNFRLRILLVAKSPYFNVKTAA
ncbi:transposase, partial [Limosilactobacillus ingluviei]|uniref:transposase n=4 Tax=Limosilactobacillus TaxID=2742598 RepID=UPI000A7D2AA7